MRQTGKMIDLDDFAPKKKPGMVIGEDLASVSVAELAHRIQDLESEIQRIRAEIAKKDASKTAAAAFFR
jgi:uncharacterized small protein (DUF1192 family)